jgi:hypothetical protein
MIHRNRQIIPDLRRGPTLLVPTPGPIKFADEIRLGLDFVQSVDRRQRCIRLLHEPAPWHHVCE